MTKGAAGMESEAESKEKHFVLDPMPEPTITSSYFQSRVDSNTFIIGNPIPESTFSPSQGLWIWPLGKELESIAKDLEPRISMFYFLQADLHCAM